MDTNEYQEIKKMLEENQTLLHAIYEKTEKTRKYIFWGKVMNLVYLLLILAPIVFAIIYLPPLLKQTLGAYQSLLGDQPNQTESLQNLRENLQKQLQMYQVK